MPLRSVDLVSLKSFNAPGVFRRIEPTLEGQLQRYPETLERLSGVVHFCACLGNQSGTDADPAARRKFLRGALSEFASLDEAASIDTVARGVNAPSMVALDDARLHVVRLLRHANIHLSVSRVNRTSKPAVWIDQSFNFQVYYSPDVSVSIARTEQAKKYLPANLSRMIDWLDREQREWGLDHLIAQAAELYARLLLKECGP